MVDVAFLLIVATLCLSSVSGLSLYFLLLDSKTVLSWAYETRYSLEKLDIELSLSRQRSTDALIADEQADMCLCYSNMHLQVFS